MTPEDREGLAFLIALTATGEEWRSPEGRYSVIPTTAAASGDRLYWCYDNHHPARKGDLPRVYQDPTFVVAWMEGDHDD